MKINIKYNYKEKKIRTKCPYLSLNFQTINKIFSQFRFLI